MHLTQLVVATHNSGKIKEFATLLKPLGIQAHPITDYTTIEPQETGQTFKENAILKARHAWGKSHLPTIGDDSGLVIPALEGRPGLYSKRWAEECGGYEKAMDQLYHEAKAITQKEEIDAYFICVIAFITCEGKHVTFEGKVEGKIIWPPKGPRSFGYDAFFKPHGETRTFGEMSTEEKNTFSHRGKAVQKFLDFIKTALPQNPCPSAP